MIERHWSAIAKREFASDYIDHLTNETFVALKTIDGFLKARILKREGDEGVHFLIITTWGNINAIRQFAGADVDTAVVPDIVRKMMVKYDRTVQHYEIKYEYSI